MRSKRLAATLAAVVAAGAMAAPAADAKRSAKRAKADPLYELVCTSLGVGKLAGKVEATVAPIVRVRLGICQPLG